jgi:hypothetical protein
MDKLVLSYACSGFSPGTLVSTKPIDKINVILILVLLQIPFKFCQAIGISNGSLVMLEVLVSAYD